MTDTSPKEQEDANIQCANRKNIGWLCGNTLVRMTPPTPLKPNVRLGEVKAGFQQGVHVQLALEIVHHRHPQLHPHELPRRAHGIELETWGVEKVFSYK